MICSMEVLKAINVTIFAITFFNVVTMSDVSMIFYMCIIISLALCCSKMTLFLSASEKVFNQNVQILKVSLITLTNRAYSVNNML